ncbi:MAG: hypothetical protein ACK4Q5_18610 [Saprospiraceae bacterium]
MDAIQVSSTPDKYVITIAKDALDQSQIMEVLRWLRLKYLIQKADFQDDVVQAGNEIVADWWEQNKARFIPAEAP